MVFISGCTVDDGPEIITLECDGFDFEIADSEWIILPEGAEYNFQGQGKTIELSSEYQISEPFTIEFENPGLSALIPIGLRNSECFSSYLSFHQSTDGNTSFFNEIRNINNGELVLNSFAIDDLRFDLEIRNDSISLKSFESLNNGQESSVFQFFDNLSLEGKTYQNILQITNPDREPKQIFIARNLGLVAYNKNDTLWLRN